MDVFGYVYLVRNKVNGKVYIGKTTKPIKERWAEHLCRAKNGYGYYLHSAIAKHGAANFDVVLLHQGFSNDELNEMEKRAIVAFDSCNRECGYNLTFGGEGQLGNEETRKKISAALSGYVHSEQSRANMSNKVISAEARANMSLAQKKRFAAQDHPRTGTTHSPETRAKIKANRRPYHPPKGRPCSEATRRKISETKMARAAAKRAQRQELAGV